MGQAFFISGIIVMIGTIFTAIYFPAQKIDKRGTIKEKEGTN